MLLITIEPYVPIIKLQEHVRGSNSPETEININQIRESTCYSPTFFVFHCLNIFWMNLPLYYSRCGSKLNKIMYGPMTANVLIKLLWRIGWLSKLQKRFDCTTIICNKTIRSWPRGWIMNKWWKFQTINKTYKLKLD